jgi:DNA-binding transcriptional ArsR family regulator
MADNVVFLEPGDERAQKIAKAMGSQTASDILQILGDGPRSLTDITERLNIPMNTAKYHIENLLDAGLIAVEKTKYSIKGREVKIYTLTNQLLVVAPRQSNVRSLLLKYASLFGIVALGSILISVLTPLFGPGSLIRGSANSVNEAPQVAFRQDGGAAAKSVAESVAWNGTTAPDVIMGGTKGAVDTLAANTSPAALSTHAPAATMTIPVPAPTPLIPAPQAIPPGSMESGAGAIFTGLDPALAFFLGGVLVIFILVCYEAWVWKKQYK